MATSAGGDWQRWFGLRAVAVAVPCGMALLALLLSMAVDFAGVHLCGWPATISCGHGLPVAWSLLRWLLWGFAIASAVDAAFFLGSPTRDAGNRLLVWAGWGPATFVATVAAGMDRRLDLGEVLVGAVVLVVGLVNAARVIAARSPLSGRAVAVAVMPLIVVAATAPLWVPPALVAVRDAEPTREERARRRAAEQCERVQQAGGGRPEAGALPACEVVDPVPGPTPP